MILAGSSVPIQPAKKRKGPKGPNPLSIKKKKPLSVAMPKQSSIKIQAPIFESESSGRKRKVDNGDDQEADSDNNSISASKRKRKRRKKMIARVDSI